MSFMGARIDGQTGTMQRAGLAFAVSLALHAGVLGAGLWLLGARDGAAHDAYTLSVTLAATPSRATATESATGAVAAPESPAQNVSTGQSSDPGKARQVAVISTAADAETEAERRLREALAALTASSIDPPAHSQAAAESSAATAAPPAAADTTAATTAGADAAQQGFVELHVLDWLAQHRRYPRAARRAGVEGTVHVRFAIDPLGRIDATAIETSSGARVLDRAALALLDSASPVPGLAQFGLVEPMQLRLPIDYRLRRPARAG
jgi:protein TonB